MKNLLVLFALLLASVNLQAQVFSRLDAPVIKDDTPMLSPWAGGVNAPQWSAADLNNDGTMDLFAFDRDGHVNMPFINLGQPGEISYAYAHEYLSNFPKLHDYVMLRDYDQDGIMDIFAHAGDEGVPGYKVFDGYYEDGELKFERLKMGHFGIDILTVPLNNGGDTNLNVSRPDYPSVEDVDGDGDLDIVSLYSTSGNTLVYYQNMAIEQGFTLDTLIFKTEETCFAGVFIPTLTTSLVLSCHPDSCGNACPALVSNISEEERTGGVHGASTLLTYDFDNDGDSEILYGDLQYPNIIFLENDNSSGTNWAIEQDTVFPSYDSSIDLNNFPASFKVDIDNDGTLEFMFSPNFHGATLRDHNNVFFYENTGSNDMVELSKQSENLIQRDMIDLGTGAQPAFFDHNADGLMDFLVGNLTAWTPSDQPNEAFLQLFENTGTTDAPAFTLIDDNYLNFKQFSIVATSFAPTFGDLDNDGDEDLVIGQEDGSLFFVENIGGPNNPVIWGPPQANWKNIDVGQFATPHLYDANDDGLLDLLVGHKLGTVIYFQNVGTASFPDFNPDLTAQTTNTFLGMMNTQDQSQTNQGLSAPVVLDFGDTTYIIVGGESGYIEAYFFDADKLTEGAFEQVSEQFAGLYDGTYSRIAFANLNDDDYLDALLGNHRGGLALFTSPFKTTGLMIDAVGENLPDLEFEIYPNPTDGLLQIQVRTEGLPKGQYRLFSSLGQLALQGNLRSEQSSIDVSGLTPGLYILEVQMDGLSGVKKVFVK